MKNRVVFFFFFLFMGITCLFGKNETTTSGLQQSKTVSGIVTSTTGEPLIGASIMVKGTTIGTITDIDGNFKLDIPSRESILVFAYLGYVTQEVKADSRTNFSIRMTDDAKLLDEIVVVGYGTQKKGEVASAISTIKSDQFLQGVVTNDAAQLIRGQVAGLTIVTPDGNPTSTSQIALRGITTLKSSTSPLILIDGVPGDLNSISPQDIEQIDVLKDGSAAAIYGTRATNGVILITTKSVRGEMPTTVELNVSLSTQQITKKLPFMNAAQYRELVKAGKPGAQDDGASTDWLDEVLRTPFTQIYSVNLKGGSKNTNYVATLEYRGMKGIMDRSDNEVLYPRIEVTHRMFNDKLKLTGNIYGYKQSYHAGSNYTEYKNVLVSSSPGSFNLGVYRNALTYNPTTPLRDADGNWSENPSKTDYFNPMALLWESNGKNETTSLRANGTITYTPVKGLDIKYMASTNTIDQMRGYYETKKHISTIKDNKNGYASRGSTRFTETISELTAQYNTTVAKDHTFTLLGGYSWLKSNYQSSFMDNYNFPSDDYSYNYMEAGKALKDGLATQRTYQKENTLIGYFGRLNYNYKGRYMLAASVRHEGSSKFGANYKWGTFPAISGAWNIKEESFMKEIPILSMLKLRAGYGITGTEPIDPYMSLNTLNFDDYIYYNGEWIKSVKPNSNSNPNIRWEKKKESNFGIDFGFMDNRIYGSIDYYIRDTKDLLWDYTVPAPPYLYSTMVANAGTIRNKGLEAMVTVIPVQTKDWTWSSSVNYSTNTNKLLSLSNDEFISSGYSDQGGTGEPIQQSTHRIEEGMAIGNFYGFKSIDIDESGRWIIEGADGQPKPISEQQPTDKKYLGNGLPKHYLNWNNTVSYKNLDLTITMRGAFDYQILNMPELQYSAPVMLTRGNIFAHSYDKIYGKTPLSDNQELQYVSYYIEDGDYWKIDNVTLGYTLNFKKSWINSLRIYGTVTNLLVITGYSGIDPEVSMFDGTNQLAPGRDDKNRYPASRTYTLGVSFKF